MGICLSSSYQDKEESDGNIVYMVEDEGLCSNGEDGMRRLASLYSQKGKKGPNQDSAILCQGYGMEGVFCGVFDGHGRNGHMVSRLVRDYLPSILLNQYNALMLADVGELTDSDDRSSVDDEDRSSPSSDLFDEWKEACISGFKAMDRELKVHPDMDCSYSGTTAVTIIKQGKDLIIANLGDSRAVLGTITDDGCFLKAVQLTTDLKPDLPEEAERIRKNNGRVFALRDEPRIHRVWLPNDNYPGLAMARAFGDFQLKNYGIIATPQVSYHRLTSRDQFIVLATDGVWDVLSNDKVVEIVWSTSCKEEASRAVVEEAVRAWRHKYPASKVDDCTAVCVFLKDWKQDLYI